MTNENHSDVLPAVAVIGAGTMGRQIAALIADGDAVLAWTASTDAGFDFETFGRRRRVPVDFDGLKLVAFVPAP